MMRKYLLIFACIGLTGCSNARVLGGDENGVWVKEPLIGSGNPHEIASEFCAQYGKRAVYEQNLQISNDDVFQDTLTYACR